MSEQGLDCVVAAGAKAVNHLLGYWRYFGGAAAAVIEPTGARTLLVPRDEATSAEIAVQSCTLLAYGERGFGLVPDQGPALAEALSSLPQLRGRGGVGLAGELPGLAQLLVERLGRATFDANAELERIRLVKDEDELERIRYSYELAWTAQRAVRERADAGASEIELFTAGQSAAQLAAGEPIEFMGDMLCGARSSEVCAPIRVASRVAVEPGDAILSDLVVGCRGYWGDTAETIIVGERPEIATTRARLLELLADGARLLTPGRPAREVFAALHDSIAAAYPSGEFPHHGGHGVGLGSYEDPHVIPDDAAPLQAGMVIALEPGVYFAGRFGARVERMYVVDEAGGQELTGGPDGR
jgi:Xaa-Pro aminopeptidase